MEIIPAIDLRQGRCVRLYQGDFARETVFSHDPAETARQWEAQGALRLHIVDLDGAARGKLKNLPAIEGILRAIRIPAQVGGGVRDLGAVERLLGLGVSRVILGTMAAQQPGLLEQACHRFGEAIVVAVDYRYGVVSIQGWHETTGISVTSLVQQATKLGVRRFICTDVLRDGTLTQPNFEIIHELVTSTPSTIIASGGVTTLEHLQKLKAMGVEGAIVGRALYEGALSLPEALRAVR